MENSFVRLIKYFSHNSRPVSRDEFRDFWGACTSKERAYFRTVNLETGEEPLWMKLLSMSTAQSNMDKAIVCIEKTCSVCGKINWDSKTGIYNETHLVVHSDEMGTIETRVPCDTSGIQYWQYEDGTLESRTASGRLVKEL